MLEMRAADVDPHARAFFLPPEIVVAEPIGDSRHRRQQRDRAGRSGEPSAPEAHAHGLEPPFFSGFLDDRVFESRGQRPEPAAARHDRGWSPYTFPSSPARAGSVGRV